VLLFSAIEFQYNTVLAGELDANGIAQVTANLASIASVGQTAVNLLLMPPLLRTGLAAALVVTPIAYLLGESLVLFSQTVAAVFACRSMDFIFRYTVSDSTKQLLYKAVPPTQLMEARAFTDGTIKKLGPMLLGAFLIGVQAIFGAHADALVVPMSVGAAGAALALLPLVLALARMGDAASRPAPNAMV